MGWLSGAAWIVPLSTIFPGSPVITEEVCFKDIKKIVSSSVDNLHFMGNFMKMSIPVTLLCLLLADDAGSLGHNMNMLTCSAYAASGLTSEVRENGLSGTALCCYSVCF